jgi:hypothetical protein
MEIMTMDVGKRLSKAGAMFDKYGLISDFIDEVPHEIIALYPSLLIINFESNESKKCKIWFKCKKINAPKVISCL